MKKKKHLKKYITLYLIFLPVAIWYIIFKYIPMGGIIIAFKSFSPMKGIGGSPFVGMANFERLFKSSAFLSVLKNNIILSVMDICIVFPAPIILALSINEVKNKMGKRVVQSITYLPHFISWAVAGGLFYMFFSVSTGPVNAVIKAAGGAGINFMGSSVWYRWMVVLSSVWKEVGWGSIVYLAAITGVDEELYEAAEIDGCTQGQFFFRIALPLSAAITAILVLYYGVGHWNAYFSALVYISDSEKYPLQLVLRNILITNETALSQTATTEAARAALREKQELIDVMKYSLIIISSIPVLLLYPFIQKHFVKGVMIGSLKG